jgi:hypothetical protein
MRRSRTKSPRRTRIPGRARSQPRQSEMITRFGKSRSMGRGKDKELTRGSSPMRRSNTKSPRRTRIPGRAPRQPRQSASTQRKSRTSKREDTGKILLASHVDGVVFERLGLPTFENLPESSKVKRDRLLTHPKPTFIIL